MVLYRDLKPNFDLGSMSSNQKITTHSPARWGRGLAQHSCWWAARIWSPPCVCSAVHHSEGWPGGRLRACEVRLPGSRTPDAPAARCPSPAAPAARHAQWTRWLRRRRETVWCRWRCAGRRTDWARGPLWGPDPGRPTSPSPLYSVIAPGVQSWNPRQLQNRWIRGEMPNQILHGCHHY